MYCHVFCESQCIPVLCVCSHNDGHTGFRMNKLNVLPRGFGAFPALEVLDLTYNNLNENSLPGNFFCLSMLFIVLHVACPWGWFVNL